MAISDLIAQYLNGATNKDLELALVNHPDTPKDILEQLINSKDREVAQAASLHVNLAGEIEGDWYELAESVISQKDLGQNDLLIYELLEFAVVPDYFISEWMPWEQITKGIENPNIPVLWRNRLLSRLANNDKVDVRMWVAAYEHTPVDILKQLAGDSDIKVRTIVSLQPNFSPKWFKSIKIELGEKITSLEWIYDYLNYCKLDYRNTPFIRHYILKCLATNINIDFDIRQTVINQSQIPVSVIKILAKDNNPAIRIAVIHNCNTPLDILEELANDSDYSVRKALASCYYTPQYIRKKLATDECEEVRQAVNDNKDFYGESRCKNYFEKSIASLKLSQQFLQELAEDRTPQTEYDRLILAKAKDTPGDILEKLISSSEINIRYHLAKRDELRWDLSEKLWQELINDPQQDKIYEESEEYLDTHFHVNLAIRLELLPYTLATYIKGDNTFSRFIALSHPLLPDYLFKNYVKSQYWLEKYALTQNPKLPDKIREILIKDPNKVVRAAARANGYIPKSLSNIIIPKIKTDNDRLIATLKVLIKELVRDKRNDNWRDKESYKTILWKIDNKQNLSFANFIIAHKILTNISLNEFIQGFQKQASHQVVNEKEFSFQLIDPPITSESIHQCQLLLECLQNNCEHLEAYQINFRNRENIFPIVVGQIKDGNWLGISPVIKSSHESLNKTNLKSEKINIDFSFFKSLEFIITKLNPSIRFPPGLQSWEFGQGLIYEIATSKSCLIGKLLESANFIVSIKLENNSELLSKKINKFFRTYLSNFQEYRIGHWLCSSFSYTEKYTIGETPQGDWLVLKTEIFSC